MAQVQVKLYASLRSHVGGAPSLDVEIKPRATVAELLEGLGVPTQQARIVFVNNRVAGLSRCLDDGDRVGVFPAIGGG